MIEFHGQVVNGCLILPQSSESLRGRWLNESEGKYVTERLLRRTVHGTLQQGKAHWGLAVTMIRERMIELGWDVCGIAPNKEMIHEILLKACGGVGDLGECLRFHEMSVGQRMQFFENIRAWAATQLQLNIPDPDKNWRRT